MEGFFVCVRVFVSLCGYIQKMRHSCKFTAMQRMFYLIFLNEEHTQFCIAMLTGLVKMSSLKEVKEVNLILELIYRTVWIISFFLSLTLSHTHSLSCINKKMDIYRSLFISSGFTVLPLDLKGVRTVLTLLLLLGLAVSSESKYKNMDRWTDR